jgi:hypothetical protein
VAGLSRMREGSMRILYHGGCDSRLAVGDPEVPQKTLYCGDCKKLRVPSHGGVRNPDGRGF